jgi:putative two-component system response regulator
LVILQLTVLTSATLDINRASFWTDPKSDAPQSIENGLRVIWHIGALAGRVPGHGADRAVHLDAALQEFPGVKFLEMGRDIAATHHERFDGEGYPRKLAGEDIPLCGRIVALADVYDALTSKRVYKSAMAHDVAKAMILAESGSHFDPDLVDAMVQNESRFLSIRNHFADAQAEAA